MAYALWKSHQALCDNDNFKINQSVHFGSLRTAAITLFGELGAWVYDEWQTLNRKYFENRNTAGAILWGITPYSGSWGYWLPEPGLIYMHTSLVIPSNIERPPWGIRHLNKLFASDVLLHEMIHQRIDQLGIKSEKHYSTHNNTAWVNEVSRLAPLLGFNIKASLIRQRRVNGKRRWLPDEGCIDYKKLAAFPLKCRPQGHYEQVEGIVLPIEVKE